MTCVPLPLWRSEPAYPSIVRRVWLIAARNTLCNFATTMLQLQSHVNSFPLLHGLCRGESISIFVPYLLVIVGKYLLGRRIYGFLFARKLH